MQNKYTYIPFVLIIFLLILVIGCREKRDSNRGISGTKYNSYDDFRKSAGGFPYTVSGTKRIQLISNYSNLSLGMSKKDVYGLLGEPDIEEKMFSKFKKPGFLGWCWTYYLYKSDSWGQNLKDDQEIEIFYDKNGKAIKIVPLNIIGLAEKGSCKRLQLIIDYEKISLGMTKQKIFDILGKPDEEVKIYSKENGTFEFIGWSWSYNLYELVSGERSFKQVQRIEIFYDKNGKAIKIVPLNIEGLLEKQP